jgi:hypothetical protein
MVWLLIAAAICAIMFVAGRAHSRYLDRLEARRKVVVTIQLFNVSPEIIKESKFTADLTSEASRHSDRVVDSSVGNKDEIYVRSPSG